ncbi:HdeD family acid-resistance protein [Dyella sp. Tek66A03]|uniref:HdeD family acid-resistance protein n=1 Tax=Dyella sp. Tek66A03 TaxID=3458298 RepID=UPI00403EBA5E
MGRDSISHEERPTLSGELVAIGRSWWVLLPYGVFAVAFGILAIASPLTAAALAWAVGVMALAEGIIGVFALFDRYVAVSEGWLVFYELASIAFGLLAIINPLATASMLLLLLAAWMIAGGIYRIVFAIRVRNEVRGEWLIILSGALGILLGMLFALSPLSGIVVATLWIGVGALFFGALQIVAAFRIRKFKPV